jgi:hypothetical protein
MWGSGHRGGYQNAGGVEGLISLAREPRLRAGVFAGMGVGEAEEPLDALLDRALEDVNCTLGTGGGLGRRVAVGRPAVARRGRWGGHVRSSRRGFGDGLMSWGSRLCCGVRIVYFQWFYFTHKKIWLRVERSRSWARR